MNYEVKKLPGSTLEVTVTVEASAVAAEQEKVVNKLENFYIDLWFGL